MTKAEAVKILAMRFHNDLIAHDWQDISDEDLAIMKALKIVNPKEQA